MTAATDAQVWDAGNASATWRIKRMSEVPRRAVDWLWKPRLALGEITLIGGRQGVSKSLLSYAIAARVTNPQAPWPDDADTIKGEVLLISCEDGEDTTIGPRLDAAHCDSTKVLRVWKEGANGEVPLSSLVDDLEGIEQALTQNPAIRLVIVDPILTYTHSDQRKINTHMHGDVRPILARLQEIAERFKVAMLLIAHLRKDSEGDAMDLFLGTNAFTTAARNVFLVAEHPEKRGTLVMAQAKTNHEKARAVEYIIEACDLPVLGAIPRVRFIEGQGLDLQANELIGKRRGKPGPEAKALKTAIEFFINALQDGPKLRQDLMEQAGWKGITESTFNRAVKELKLVSDHLTVAGQYKGKQYRLPEVPK